MNKVQTTQQQTQTYGSSPELRVALYSKEFDIFKNIPVDSDHIFMAWHDGERQESFLALGEMQPPIEVCSSYFEQEIQKKIQGDIPLFWGGMSFTRERTWASWPIQQFFSPRVLWVQDGTQTRKLSWHTETQTPKRQKPTTSQGFVEESNAHWKERLSALSECFAEKTLQKVVAARSVSVFAPKGQRIDHRATFVRLKKQNPRGYTFALCLGTQEVFLGASPETLVAVRNQRLTTHALAGTIARGTTTTEDIALQQQLLQNERIQHEHRYVVQEIVDNLRDVCEGLQQEAKILQLPRVQHLETRISAKLRSPQHILSLVNKLHPTPALAGSPRNSALQWLEAHEPLLRGWYGGPIGWYNAAGEGVFAVAIRSMLLRRREAVLFAGAGLVEGFSADEEWNETSLKLATAHDALAFCPESQ